jgi:thymidylate kinase
MHSSIEPLSVSHEVRSALKAGGVCAVHWKSNSHLAEALAGKTDMDLYVCPEQAQAFSRILSQLGGLKISSQPWARYPGIEDWLMFDGPSGNLLHLHVHFLLLTGLKRVKHLNLPWREAFLANLRNDPATGWPIPTAEMELLTLLVRLWAKMPPWRQLISPKVPGHIGTELSLLVKEAEPPKLAALAKQLGLQLDSEDLQLLFNPSADRAHAISVGRRFYRQLRSHFRLSWSRSMAQAALLNLQVLMLRLARPMFPLVRHGKTLPGGGALIAVIGADGSGKSTLTADLTRWLRFKLDVHRLYMGSGSGAAGWVQAIRRKLSGSVRRLRRARATSQAGEEPRLRSYGFAEKIYRLVDLQLMNRKLRLLRRARRMAAQGSVIVLDRYPQDQVDAISDGPRLQNGRSFAWAAEREKKLYGEAGALGPDMVIKLSIDPATALSRKPDHDPAAIIRKCKIVDELAFSRSHVVTIDANCSYDEVLHAAKQAIWNFLLSNEKERQPVDYGPHRHGRT